MRPASTFRSRLLAVVLSSAALASCTGAPDRESAGTSSRRHELPGGDISGFQAADSEAIVLGGLDHVVTGIVRDIAAIPESYGRSGLTFEVASVNWHAEARWFFGDRQTVAPLQPGDHIYVAVDDEWALTSGAEATLALSMIPFAQVEGYARVVLGADALADGPSQAEGETRDLGPGAMQRYLQQAAQIRRVSLDPTSNRAAQTQLVIELIADARQWLDEQNAAPPGSAPLARPGGLIAEVNAAIAHGQRPAEERADDLLGVPADLRQLPLFAADAAELSSALGVTFVEAQGAVFDETRRYTFFALRFDGVGVLGPWSADHELSYGRLRGLAPRSGDVELLGWVDADPQPTSAISLGEFAIPTRWKPASESLIVTVREQGGIRIELATHAALTRRIDTLLATRSG